MPAAVAPNAGERESEAPLGESESIMVGVTASAPIDARRSRPSVGRSAAAVSVFLPRSRAAAPCYARVSSLSPIVSFYPSRDRRYRVVFISLVSSPRLAPSHARLVAALHVRHGVRFTFRTRPSSPANIIRGRSRIRVVFVYVCVCVYMFCAIRGSPGEFSAVSYEGNAKSCAPCLFHIRNLASGTIESSKYMEYNLRGNRFEVTFRSQ